MKKREKIFWGCFALCGLIIVCTWLHFMESKTLLSGLAWFLSLSLSAVPVAAVNLTQKH